MKYQFRAVILIDFCALIIPVNLFVMKRMLQRAEEILRNGGVEIINGKVDVTQIPVEEDY